MSKVNKNNESNSVRKLNANNEGQLKAYFEQVFKLSKSGEEFPINLDEVWPLVYSRKQEAVRSLKADFIQDVDFQLLRKNAQQTNRGGNNKVTYKLSLSCMEFFIARKVRPVFEVYRQVTHRTHEVFTNYKNIADHQKMAVQKQNSKDVNAYHYFNGGVEDIIEYNRKNCIEHTGKKPSEWKLIGKERGLKSKECSSGKEVLRHLQPESACGMSFVDNMVKMGAPVDKAIELSKKYAVHLFKGMLDLGATPEELNQ